jgi:hypothetical protein
MKQIDDYEIALVAGGVKYPRYEDDPDVTEPKGKPWDWAVG